MATHDYIISNASGAAVRSDLNNALAAIVSNNSSATEPATPYSYMWWADTTSGQLKLRNAANDDWVVLLELDGTTLMEDGTVSAPGLAFADDLNTGFHRPAADSLGIATNGTNAIYIDSSQNVGVGTTSPGSYLAGARQLVISASASTGLTIATPTSSSATIAFADGTGAADNARGLIRYGHSDNSLQFSTNALERLRIDSSGNVGIGTTSPGYLADLNGNSATLRLDSSSNSKSGNSALRFLDNTGNFSSIFFGNTDDDDRGAIQYVHSDDSLRFTVAASERARIDSSGRVGIGNSIPGSFDVNADDLVVGSGSGDKGISIYSGTGSTGNIYFADGTSGVEKYRGVVGYSHTLDTMFFYAAAAERGRFDSAGYIYCYQSYTGTTAIAANLVVLSNGAFLRSSSSAKYKTQIEDLQDQYADALLACRPVWYRSTCAADNPNHGYWGFIAEEVAEIDPRLVQWKTTEISYDENGSAIESPCDPEPEGVAYDRFVPHLLNLIKRQQQAIETLEAKVAALESV